MKCPENNQPKPRRDGGRTKKMKKSVRIHALKEAGVENEHYVKTVWPMFRLFTVVDFETWYEELIAPVRIDGKPMNRWLDNGAFVSFIVNNLWVVVFRKKSLYQSDVKLLRYSGHKILVMGEATVRVCNRNQEACPLVVDTANDFPSLIGRNWLSVLKLDGRSIEQVSLESCINVEGAVSKYAPLWNGGLGTIKEVAANLELKEKVVPQFFTPRSTCSTCLKEKTADELRILERIGVLEKVETSDWATPIFPVLKPDATVRICGDYKITINPALDVPEYLMPSAEGYRLPRHQGDSPPRNDLATNVLATKRSLLATNHQ